MTRPGRHELSALDPSTGKPRPIWITTKLVDDVFRYQPRWRYYELRHNVPPTLRLPPKQRHRMVIFKGIRRHGERDDPDWGYCYVGDPKRVMWKYDNDGNQLSPKVGTVFATYLSDDWHIIEWRWEAADPFDPRMPRQFAGGRYGALIWPKNGNS